MERCIVRAFSNRKLQSTKEFDEYEKALDYAISSSYKGFDCLVLRQVEKTWVKFWVNCPETI